VIADPGPLWRPLIEQENATYGDILMTDHEFESSRYSTTTKTIEAFQKIMMNRKKYTFVSRLDEDSFLDAKTFHSVWLAPLIASHTTQDVYIGRKEQHMYPFKFASAQFYTLSWDMVVALTNLWFLNHMEDEREDVMMGRLLYEGDIRYNLTVLPYRASFEYDLEGESGDGSAWANPLHFVDDASSHAISAGSVNVAHLKDDDLYLRVAACFDENGVALEDNSVNWGRYMSTEEGWTVGWRDL
jgi:beta-1,3-galactosyltransferase 1